LAQQKVIPIRFVYRSESMVPLMSIMENGGIWKQHGIDVRDYRYSDDPLDSEEQLLDGGIDFIFGNHVSPYMRLAQGEPMVCLAQTENWLHSWIATSEDVTDLHQLQNKRVVAVPLFVDGKFAGHGNGNRILQLELEGLDTGRMEFIHPKEAGNAVEAVRDGKASALFVSPDRAQRAIDAGLKIHRLSPMPMVHSITFTTTQPRLRQEEDFAERIMKVLVEATAFFKTKKDESLELLKTPIAPFRTENDYQKLVDNYEEMAAEYETKPYPRAEAIINVHKLACMVYPEAKTVNPLELWDTQTLRQIHSTGYVDNLYGGKNNVITDINKVLHRGECDD
jgi:ABC-type nitrate/sulfonate/bicarbonate transport system substrate-binding protein